MRHIFNASLEESMNVVTDKYVQRSIETAQEPRLLKKVIGAFFMLLVMSIFHIGCRVMAEDGRKFLFLPPTVWSSGVICLGILVVISYIDRSLSLKNKVVLIEYHYMTHFSILAFFLNVQLVIMAVSASSIVWGNTGASLLYGSQFLLAVVERIHSFKNNMFQTLFHETPVVNPAFSMLEKFVPFAKRYGAAILFLLAIGRFFLPNNPYQNGWFRGILLIFFPILLALSLYFAFALLDEYIAYKDSSIFYKGREADYSKTVREFQVLIHSRKQMVEQPPQFIFIGDVPSFLSVGGISEADFAFIYEEGARVGIHLIYIVNKSYMVSTSTIQQYLKKNIHTAVLAMKMSDQTLFTRSSFEREAEVPLDVVYLHAEDRQTRLKISRTIG